MSLPTLGYVQRLYDFIRRHPMGVDTFWAVMLFGFSMLWVIQVPVGVEARWSAAFIVLLLCVVVALRRRMPEKMLVLAAVLGVAQLVADVDVNPADFAMLVIIYTVAADAGCGPYVLRGSPPARHRPHPAARPGRHPLGHALAWPGET